MLTFHQMCLYLYRKFHLHGANIQKERAQKQLCCPRKRKNDFQGAVLHPA